MVILKSSLINGEHPNVKSRATLTKQATAVQVQRLSEKTLSVGGGFKRCDSPNPGKIVEAIQMWERNLTWKEMSDIVGIPARTLKRYLHKMGYMRDYKFVSLKLKGRFQTEEHKRKVSETRILTGVAKGEKNPNWNGGISNPKVQVWNTIEYKLWRKSVFTRDNFTCKGCGIQNKKGLGKTVRIEAHHILPRRNFPHLVFELTNGITLCEDCHNKTKNKEHLSENIWKQRVGSI